MIPPTAQIRIDERNGETFAAKKGSPSKWHNAHDCDHAVLFPGESLARGTGACKKGLLNISAMACGWGPFWEGFEGKEERVGVEAQPRPRRSVFCTFSQFRHLSLPLIILCWMHRSAHSKLP